MKHTILPWLFGTCLLLTACSDDDDDDNGGGGGPPAGATPSALIDSGKAELLAGNLVPAREDFEQAEAHADASFEQMTEARLYLAFLRLGLAFDAEGEGDSAVAFRELMARFGLPPEGPDVLAFDDYLAALPDPLPADSPNQAELRAYVESHLIPALEQAEAELAALPPSVQSTLPTQGGTFQIDVTDVLAARTLLVAAESQAELAAAYGGSVDLDATLADGDLDPNAELLADGDFLTLQDPARLVASQDAMRRAIELYDQALASLQAETDDQSDDVVVFGGATPDEVAAAEQRAVELALLFDQVHAAIVAPPAAIELENGYPLLLDLGTAFTELDLRGELPTFDDDLEHGAFATLDAPVLNGIFPGLTGLQANKSLRLLVPLPGGHAVQVLPGAISIEDGTTADWGIVPAATQDPTGIEDFTSETDAGLHAMDVAAIYLAQENTHVPAVDRYLYRVDFAGGEPDALENVYRFRLEPNEEGVAAPSFLGTIEGSGGSFQLTVVREDTGDTVLGPSARLVGGGDGFLEWGFQKQLFVDAGVANGTEYALTIECTRTDPVTLEVARDRAMPIRYAIDL